MAIKEIKPEGVENLFPGISKGGVSVITLPSQGTTKRDEEDVQTFLDKYQKRRLVDAEVRKVVSELGGPAPPEDTTTSPKASPKRYLVDLETGGVTIEEEDGEYTYKEAQLISASIKGKKGEYEGAITLIKAAKELGERPPTTETAIGEKKTEWYVDDDTGIIVHDPENGEFTLSEARALSQSRQRALFAGPQDVMTPEKLELFKRDVLDETTRSVSSAVASVEGKFASQEPAITINEKGDLELDPSRKPGLTEILVYMLSRRNERPYTDKSGNIFNTLPEAIDFKRFEREEGRKDDMATAIRDTIQEGRRQFPALVQSIKNLGPGSKEGRVALDKGGWGEKGKEEPPEIKIAPCAGGCGETITYSVIPAIVRCPKCQSLNFFGAPDQYKELLQQLYPEEEQSKTKKEESSRESATDLEKTSKDLEEPTPKQE